jgi:hypothetical protein
VKLSGGLPGTASYLYNAPDGGLVVELYDFSEQAESFFGNDVAFQLHIAAADKEWMLALLQEVGDRPGNGRPPDLFGLLQARFDNYYPLKRWLDANAIPYREEFDGLA